MQGLNYKIYAIEKHRVKGYGDEVPTHFRPAYIPIKDLWVIRLRCMAQFYVRYYAWTQNYTDSFADNSNSPMYFKVLKYKGVVRYYRYMKQRDSSFDFMDIGEDVYEQVDDGI